MYLPPLSAIFRYLPLILDMSYKTSHLISRYPSHISVYKYFTKIVNQGTRHINLLLLSSELSTSWISWWRFSKRYSILNFTVFQVAYDSKFQVVRNGWRKILFSILLIKNVKCRRGREGKYYPIPKVFC